MYKKASNVPIKRRLEKYVKLFDKDEKSCLELYVYNTVISEALYTPLQGIEIALRNAVDLQLAKTYGPDWHTLARKIFNHPLTEMIDSADAKLHREKAIVTRGRLVAELNFGFWIGALAPRYDAPLWRQSLRHAFPLRPRGHERKQVHGALNAVRRLRNRVMHHEPILHRDLKSDHDVIMHAISWICPETARWISEQSRFSSVFRPDLLPSAKHNTPP